MWSRRFDTQSIAERLDIPEHLAARWVANFRDVLFAGDGEPPPDARVNA